jgi:hypothetical protein
MTRRRGLEILARRIVDKESSTIAAQRSGGKEIDDLLNGFVGAMVGGFELAGRLVMGVRAVVEAAVGERAAEPFVKEQPYKASKLNRSFGRGPAVRCRSPTAGTSSPTHVHTRGRPEGKFQLDGAAVSKPKA